MSSEGYPENLYSARINGKDMLLTRGAIDELTEMYKHTNGTPADIRVFDSKGREWRIDKGIMYPIDEFSTE